MLKKTIAVCAVLALLPIAFWIGRGAGIKLQTKRDLDLHKKLVELDQSFLTDVVTRPGTMTSGAYTLETKFAGKTGKVSGLELEFSNSRLVKVSGQTQGIVQNGNMVSWQQYDMDEGPGARFVGVIDGDMMWGRVYVEPGQGWHEGEPPAYGVWSIRRASSQKPGAEQVSLR